MIVYHCTFVHAPTLKRNYLLLKRVTLNRGKIGTFLITFCLLAGEIEEAFKSNGRLLLALFNTAPTSFDGLILVPKRGNISTRLRQAVLNVVSLDSMNKLALFSHCARI